MAEILKGQTAAQAQLEKIKRELGIDSKVAQGQRPPCLCIIQVGNDPASSSYIKQKQKLAMSQAFRFEHHHLSADISKADLQTTIEQLVNDKKIDGILLQLPLDSPTLNQPDIIHELLACIPPHKDADGLNPFNQGKLYAGESTPQRWTAPIPCTALGIFRLLEHYNIPVVGKRITVVGASRLVGMPTAGLLTQAGATVTICNSKTKDLASECLRAEILIVAAGKRHLIKPHMIQNNTIVVDVGIHRNDDGTLTGDVDPQCYEKCHSHTPVPGGVGPMTVAMLIENTMRLWKTHS